MLNYEIIDATKVLNITRSLDKYKAPFIIIDDYRLIDDGIEPEATVQIKANGKYIHEAATGSGPVDALAKVLKKALTPQFPFLEKIKLIDYGARILDSRKGTGTTIDVNITFTNGKYVWKVYSSSANINAASFIVLVDGFEYAILRELHSNNANKES